MNMYDTFKTPQTRIVGNDNSWYGHQIAQAQDYEDKAMLFCEIANEAEAEGNTRKSELYLKRAQEAWLQGSRYHRAAKRHISSNRRD